MQRLNPGCGSVRTSIMIDNDMISEIDKAIKKLKVSKSEFIRKALRAEIKRVGKKK